MLVDFPEWLVEEFQIAEAGLSGRAIQGMKSMEQIEKTLENAHRVLEAAQDKASTIIVREIAKKRGF